MPKLSDVTKYTNPISGQQGNLMNLGQSAGLVKGVVVLSVLVAAGLTLQQWLAQRAKGIPFVGSWLGSGTPFTRPAQANPPQSQGPNYRVYG